MEVTPRYGDNSNGISNREILRPHTGMTIRLTPELLGLLKGPGLKPKIELVLKSAGEGEIGLWLRVFRR